MKKKAVLYIGGGAMAGVFGAGVVTGLQEVNAYEKFSHAYGASAGAFDIAYFLAKQTRKGSSIYWEDLIKGFINFSNLPKAIMNIILGRKNFPNVVDINYVIKVVQTIKELDLEEIRKNPIEAKVKVYNLIKKRIEYLDLKKNTLERLKESSSVIPYFYFKNQENIDGEGLDCLGYDFLRKEHPQQKLIFVINQGIKRRVLRQLRNLLEGKLISKIFDDSTLGKRFSENAARIEEECEKIRRDKNALLITPPENNPTSNTTRNPNKLRYTHSLGIAECQKILEFIKE